jgi:16S rRNA (guanine1516-N2)-methyltransferase
MQPASLAVATRAELASEAQQLAQQLAVPLCDETTADCDHYDFVLHYLAPDPQQPPQLTLLGRDGSLGKGFAVDFVAGRAAHRRRFGGGRGQPLARAVGLKGGANPRVVDATAGLGRDAFVLACLGAQVTLIERAPVLAALLEDGLQRAARDPELAAIVTAHMRLVHDNAIHWLSHCEEAQRPEVVYLDPMYPHRTKSALVKKEMRALRALVGDDEDADQLLTAALACAKKRVVVKRPKGAPPLAGPRPGSCVESKNTRYDLYPTG